MPKRSVTWLLALHGVWGSSGGSDTREAGGISPDSPRAVDAIPMNSGCRRCAVGVAAPGDAESVRRCCSSQLCPAGSGAPHPLHTGRGGFPCRLLFAVTGAPPTVAWAQAPHLFAPKSGQNSNWAARHPPCPLRLSENCGAIRRPAFSFCVHHRTSQIPGQSVLRSTWGLHAAVSGDA